MDSKEIEILAEICEQLHQIKDILEIMVQESND